MTWNLRIGRPEPGETPAETAERLGSAEQMEVAPDPAEIRRMGSLLVQAAPSLMFADVPKGWSLTHAASGAQIRMSGDEFTMIVPRVFSPSMARSVWTDLWPAIRLLSTEGYCLYAPPLRRLLDPDTDFDRVVEQYSGAAAATASAAPPAAKRWWQLWR